MCRSKSSRNNLQGRSPAARRPRGQGRRTCGPGQGRGHACRGSPGPPAFPWPCSMASRVLTIQARPLAARRAPAARFAGHEALEVEDEGHRAGPVVEHDERPGAQPASDQGLVGKVQVGRQSASTRKSGGGAAREGAPGTRSPPSFLRRGPQDLAERRAHRQLPEAGPVDLAADAVDLRAALAGQAQPAEPVGPVVDDVRDRAEGFDVVDQGGLAEKPADGREGRLGPRRARRPSRALSRPVSSPHM